MRSARELLPGLPHPVVFGHRGCPSERPENTISSFDRCLELGVHGIELDVHCCSSGELVVIHDHHLGRLAEYDATVEDLSLTDLKKLDVGSHFAPEYSDQRIPLLSEVFERYTGRFFYDIEIKSPGFSDSRNTSRAVVAAINEHGMADRCIVSSFNPFRLREVGSITKEIPTAVIYSQDGEVPALLRSGFGRVIGRSRCLKPHSPLVTEGMMRRKNRYSVLPWTVNTADEAKRVFDLGCLGIITDVPQIFTHLL